MDQISHYRFNKQAKTVMKFNHHIECLPFVSFLNKKSFQAISNSFNSTVKFLPLKRKKLIKNAPSKQHTKNLTQTPIFRIANARNDDLYSRISKKTPKQFSKNENSSIGPFQLQQLKGDEDRENEVGGSIGKHSRQSQQFFYSNYDIMNASRTYNRSKKNILTKNNLNNHQYPNEPKSSSQSRKSSVRKMMNQSKASTIISNRSKPQRILTEYINLQCILKTTRKL